MPQADTVFSLAIIDGDEVAMYERLQCMSEFCMYFVNGMDWSYKPVSAN